MALQVRPAKEEEVRAFVSWRYDAPFDAYDITGDTEDEVEHFLSPDVQCHVLVEHGALVAYCTFGDDAQVPGGVYHDDALDMGIGVDPRLTGQGLGGRYVAAVVDLARSELGARRLRVTIAEPNQRARRAAASIGFHETARFRSPKEVLGTRDFVVMELDPTTDLTS